MKYEKIGDRMKMYESIYNYKLTPKLPVIIRIDGKCFHTFTKGMNHPFDEKLTLAMVEAMNATAKEMMNFKLAYHQSDEVSFLLLDDGSPRTESWFNNEVQKLASITASTFGAYFNKAMGGTTAIFDARCFTVPLDEVPNVFIWRQRDWERNSIQMFARNFFPHSDLHNKKTQKIHEMLHHIGKNWADLHPMYKNGTFLINSSQGMKVCNDKLKYDDYGMLLSNDILFLCPQKTTPNKE